MQKVKMKHSLIFYVLQYLGGYWYENDVRGRYLHIISLKSQNFNEDGNYERYIVMNYSFSSIYH